MLCREFLVAVWLFTLVVGPALADKPPAASDLAVDQVFLKGGPRLLGSVLGREADGSLAVAVGRDWLKATHPDFFEKELEQETVETRQALTELRDRIADWRKDRQPEAEFDFFLKKELQRSESELAALEAGRRVEDSPFLVIDVPAAKLERAVQQAPQRRQIALTAWRERLADVETRAATSLVQELKKKKIELTADPDALLDLLPPRRQNDTAWAVRRAIVEYRFRKPLDFQGTGDVVIRSGDRLKAADAGKMFSDLLKSTGDNSLSALLDPSKEAPSKKTGGPPAGEKWLDSAVKLAGEEDVAGFRVTRVDQDLAQKRVNVETRFVARLPDGSWKTAWSQTESADASKPRGDAEQQIMQDPQLRAALELAKSLGVGGDEQIRLAVRFGAATMEAQKQADSRFFEFRDRYLQHLDGPVLRIAPPATPAARKK